MASDAVASLSARLSQLDPTANSVDAASSSPAAPATPQVEQQDSAPNAAHDEQEAAPEPAPVPKASQLLENLQHEVQVTLADQQQDPNSPLFSAKTFEDLNLHPNLLKGVYKMGFQKPSKIQERALPLLLQNPPRNMIGQSQSGTGKTAAFALTMLSRIDMELRKPQAICLSPARELALQTLTVVQRMGEYTPVECFAAVKDSFDRRMPPIQAQVIVGTPGTIMDAIRHRILDCSEVKVFVLDEADNLLDLGSMADQSSSVKNAVIKSARTPPQLVLFSATFTDTVRTFAVRFAPNANEIRLKQEEVALDAIKQFFMDCRDEQHKYEVLVELYNLLTIGQSIIFVARRDTSDEISRRMTAEGHAVASLTGQLTPEERDAVMESFRDGKTKVLMATNVIARGLDVMQVNMVVNYDLPVDGQGRPEPQTYIHRIGRTGRFGRQGVSINFVHDRKSFKIMEDIRNAVGKPIVRVDTSDFEQMEKVSLLQSSQGSHVNANALRLERGRSAGVFYREAGTIARGKKKARASLCLARAGLSTRWLLSSQFLQQLIEPHPRITMSLEMSAENDLHRRPNAGPDPDMSPEPSSAEPPTGLTSPPSHDSTSTSNGKAHVEQRPSHRVGPSFPLTSFESTPHNVACFAFCLGAAWSVGFTRLGIYWLHPTERSWPVWFTLDSKHLPAQSLWSACTSPMLALYLTCWAMFHLLEFVVTSMYNPGKLSVSSFLLNNGSPYHVAHAFGIVEHVLEEAYLPPKWRAFKHLGWIMVAGWVLLMGGQILRSFAMISAAQNFSHVIQTKKRDDHSLVETGIYAWSRHPSYAGFCWWALGTQIMLANPIATLAFTHVLLSFFAARIEAEEKYLVKFFGDDYISYRKRVPTRIIFIS
ncbi:BZ3500_MvSof-1268-A1-R1_Chr1-3g02360 [Microbotryum saponariae]|uniref:Protein-S-isoprenylcysteine O-methyltransferase n=1 Tax=Microbotryum saponariae TaxID=289078 RepID=A0A2X0KEP3_9BASI|nr:BZ3500_MvSof-1268-A1-R1_Chr1-3g02360 [Microbotryum saponariae]SCZ96101.1 BZ3501_MvSof-1269-A2-R1_Chr1-3g01963 [Microbotryum saponariae]